MDTDLTPLDAYSASQLRQPWFVPRWTPSMFRWMEEIAPKAGQADSLDSLITNLYIQALSRPGRDYRLAWLPDFKDFLFFSSRGQVLGDLSEVARELVRTSWTAPLARISPFSAEQISEEVASIWASPVDYHDSMRIGAFLANPNAAPEWLADQWEEYQNADLAEKLGEASAEQVFDGFAKNPSISEGLVSSLIEYSKQHRFVGLRHLLWNPAFKEVHVEEHFSAGFQNYYQDSYKPRRLLWHGNVTAARQSTQRRGSNSQKPVAYFSKDFEVDVTETHEARTEITGWVSGTENPLRYTRPDLVQPKHLNDFLMSPWTSEIHLRELERIAYEVRFDKLRSQISRALISMYLDVPAKNSDFAIAAKALPFVAEHFSRLDELADAIGAEVPTEWLLEIL